MRQFTDPAEWISTQENLHGVYLGHALLRGANLEEVDLSEAHLQGAWLGDANLQGAWLYMTNLEGANLQGANLLYADLTDAIFDETTILPDWQDIGHRIPTWRASPTRHILTSGTRVWSWMSRHGIATIATNNGVFV
jgi:hypothetical protein